MKVLVKYQNKKSGDIKYKEVEGWFEEKDGGKKLVFDFTNDEDGEIKFLEAKY